MIASLARPGDVVFSDELNHASLIDGCRLSRAEMFVYDHADVEHLAWGLRQAQGRGALIVTEAVFSMDGDVAPLEEIVELAERHRVRLVIDEAHGIGALGPGGRGALAELGLEDQVDVILGTLGKSLGSYGAFVACDRMMTQYLLNAARTVIFSTAPAPPAVAGALAALELLEERPRLVERLALNAATLSGGLEAEGFDLNGSTHAHHVRDGGRSRAHAADGRRRAVPRRVRPCDRPAGGAVARLAPPADRDGVPPPRGAPGRGTGARPGRASGRVRSALDRRGRS